MFVRVSMVSAAALAVATMFFPSVSAAAPEPTTSTYVDADVCAERHDEVAAAFDLGSRPGRSRAVWSLSLPRDYSEAILMGGAN